MKVKSLAPILEKESSGSILIVEDSALINKALCKGLLVLRHKVSSARTLKDALLALASHSFDLVVLDLNLPDGEGEEILQNLSAKQKLKIVIYTSDADKERRNEWFRYGVLGYLSKTDPFAFVIKEIDKTIKSLLENTFYTILIIDDSAFICRQITSLLQPRNYKIITASNGSEAKILLNETVIDLVILDLELPDMRGEEILKIIRKKVTLPEIPVFIMTGTYGASNVGNLIKKGANEFFLKPFIAEELLLKIDFWIDIRRERKESLYQKKILQEYKDTVDESAIVSKTNPNGIITYANSQFCKISGYSAYELIGKNHNIVHHPDMPKEVFSDMWHTIKERKETWHGKVKNLKKDGTHYWVEATIKPILNNDGEIVEYIALRHNITELENYKESLKKKLDETTQWLSEYEDAVVGYNTLAKTTPDLIIKDVNDNYSNLTKYTKEEMIGRSITEFVDEDSLRNLDEIIEVLQRGEPYKNIFKGKPKYGEPFYTEGFLKPIKNKNGEIIEHFIIGSNVTQLINVHQEIEETQKEIVYKMGEIGESRSKETGNHVRRVAEYSKILAHLVGLSHEEAEMLFIASPMHDIGKVAIPDNILNKPGKLTEEEFAIMKSHAQIGHEVLKGSSRSVLQSAAIVAYQHHERWDGLGYPQGLKAEEIHIYGRITAIADVFDALGHDRVYKKAWELDAILELFKKESGKHFDPTLIRLFFENLDLFSEIQNKFRDAYD